MLQLTSIALALSLAGEYKACLYVHGKQKREREMEIKRNAKKKRREEER